MSVINQMLRDLDRRHRPGCDIPLAAVNGTYIPAHAAAGKRAPALILGGGLAVLLVVASLFFGIDTHGVPGTQPARLSAQQPLPLALPPQTPATDRRSSSKAEGEPAKTNATQTLPLAARGRQSEAAEVNVQPKEAPLAAARRGAGSAPMSVRAADPSRRSGNLFYQAQQSLAERQPQAAVGLLQKVLATDPAHARARLQLAGLLVARGDSAAAETVLAAGLRLTPANAGMARRYARLLAQRNALQAAVDALAPLSNSEDADTLALRAELFNRLQRYDEAAATYQAALRLRPTQALWWTGLGVALEHDARSSVALEAYREAARYALPAAVDAFVQQRIRALGAHNG